MFVLNLGFPDFINEKDVDKVVDALKFAFPNITWASGKDVASKHSYDLISRSRSLIIRQPNSDDTDLLKSSNLIDDGSLGIPEPVDGWQWVNEKLSIKKSEDEGYGTTSGFFDSLNESEEKQVRPLSLCFNPPITTETWEKVAEVLYRKGISWGAYENVWGYNPFEHDVDRIMSLQYAHWRWEDKKVLTYDTDSCEALSSNHVLETANTEDGWAWVDRNTTDFDQTSDLFNSLNESLGDGESIIYEFDDRLTEKEWSDVVNSLKVLYPGILWASDDEIDHYKHRGIFGLRVRKKFSGGYELRCSDHYNWYKSHGYSNIHDGTQLLGNYDETSGLFDSLNESLITESDKKILLLGFNPRLEPDDEAWPDIVRALNMRYPGIKWSSGTPVTVSYFPADYYTFLEYSHWEGDPGPVLTYSDSEDDLKAKGVVNGREWAKINSVDYDETSNLFFPLNESLLTEGYQPRLNLYFDPPIQEGSELDSVLDTLLLVYPDLKWYGGDKLKTYNPFRYDEDDDTTSITFLTIGYFDEHPDRLTYTTGPQEPEKYSYIDGYEWLEKQKVNYDETSGFFDSLNESLLTENYQPKLCLDFDPPIYRNQFKRVAEALLSKYPELRWHSGRLFTGDEIYDRNNIEYIGNLTIGWDSDYPDRLTYDESNVGSGFAEFPDSMIINGWQWVDDNGVNYDETSGLFGQLDEQALREESLDKKITYLIEKDINIEWDAMVKILKEYFGDNVSWTGRQDISKVPTVGNNWQTLAIKYDNFYNRFLVNFGRDKPQRYFELYPEHELIKVSEVSTDIDNTSNLFNQLNESTGNRINKYKVGDKFYCKEDLRFNDVLKDRFATKGHTYEIIKIEPDYDWYEYGYKGNRYVFLLDGEKPEDANHGFSDRYIDKNFIYIPEGSDIDIDYDKLYEGYWDDLYKSKRYTQKFGIGDRVIMNGTVGGKTLTNELGTVLKFKNTGGGTGHPHRVYLILFDNWSDTKMNFLMSSVQADQNRDFTDHRCGEGRCWYSTSDYLEPAPDSNEMFNTLNESEDLDWTNDIVDSNSNFEPQDGEWIVVDTGQHYPWNPDMWQYFEIPGFNECFEGETSYGMINANRECIDDLYARGILVHPRRDDICYVNKKVWTKVTTFSKKLPVYHCIRKSDGGHFLVTSKGVEPFSSQ